MTSQTACIIHQSVLLIVFYGIAKLALCIKKSRML